MVGGGSGSFTPPVLTASTITAASEGGWVWFGANRAIRNGAETITGYTTGNSGGDVKAIRIDNATRTVLATTTLYDNFLLDDHQPPSFVVRPDGVIMAAFAYHVGDIYVGIGPSAGVLPAQANVTNITSQVGSLSGSAGYTYASIVYLPAEARYYIFFRYHDPAAVPYLGFTYSDDNGATWSARTLVANITYHQLAVNGTGRIDFVLSDHPQHGQGDNPAIRTSIFHAYYETGTGWHKSDGTALTLPIANTAATKVYDGATTKAWLWDIAILAGQPVVVYATFPDNDGTAHAYRYARWTASAWSDYAVADGGSAIITAGAEVYYSGGIVLDRTSADVVYYSTNAIGAQFQIYRAVTGDGGATWTTTALTSDSSKNVRPVSVIDADPDLKVLWLHGTYTDYFTYAQGIKGAGY